MNKRDIVIGLVVLAIIAGIVYFVKRPANKLPQVTDTPQSEELFSEKFKYDIPAGADRVDLKDISGGESSGLATRNYQNGVFTHAVLADLPDPSEGYYEGWLIKGKEGDKDYRFISTGRLKIAKGGFMLEFSSGRDYSDYSRVVVSLESKNDNKPDKPILEGNF